MQQELENPQNPYKSFLVSASAGTGKTYQLSKRFLHLVAAHTAPEKILCLTFTNKAASEMTERILSYASELILESNTNKASEEAVAFNKDAALFFELQKAKTPSTPPPLLADEVGRKILQSSGRLKISTIDSVVKKWTEQFLTEIYLTQNTQTSQQKLTYLNDNSPIIKEAWEDFIRTIQTEDLYLKSITEMFPQDALNGLQRAFMQLLPFEAQLWHLIQNKQPPVLEISPLANKESVDQDQLLKNCVDFLTEHLDKMSPKCKEHAQEFLKDPSLKNLQKSKLISKGSQALSATFFSLKTKKWAEQSTIISQTNQDLQDLYSIKTIEKLNQQGKLLYHLFYVFLDSLQKTKDKYSVSTFDDYTKNTVQMLNEPELLGISYTLMQKYTHLLFDEFQDTTPLQWSLFEPIFNELLSGENVQAAMSPNPATAFMVGDLKQSIYGFRGSEPKLLQSLESHPSLQKINLNTSYRKTSFITDYINEVFKDLEIDSNESFPEHHSAVDPNTPSTISILPTLAQTKDEGHHKKETVRKEIARKEIARKEIARKETERKEAENIAAFIHKALQSPKDYPVWDKATENYRPLQAADIALLYRTNNQSADLEKVLDSLSIPWQKNQNTGFFDRTIIEDLFHLTKLILFPKDRLAGLAVLISPIIGLEQSAIDALYTEICKDKDYSFIDLEVLNIEPKWCFLKETLAQKNYSIHKTLFKIITELDLLEAYSQNLAMSRHEITADFIKWLDTVEEIEKEYPTPYQTYFELEKAKREDSITLESVNDNSVQILTLHKSKGLEFPMVIMPHLHKEWTEKTRYWLKQYGEDFSFKGLSYFGKSSDYPEFLKAKLFAQLQNQITQESNRLFYVGLTRCRQHLVISGQEDQHYYQRCKESLAQNNDTDVDSSEKISNRSGDFDISYSEHKVTEKIRTVENLELEKKSKQPSIKWITPHQFESEAEPTTEATADLSATPKTPSVNSTKTLSPNLSRAVGLCVHRGLEQHFRKQTYSLEEHWSGLCSEDSEIPLKALQEHRSFIEEQILNTIQNKELAALMEQASDIRPELSIRSFKNHTWLRGQLDLMIRSKENQVYLIDFKTSDPKQSSATQQQRYKQQIQLYKDFWQDLEPKTEVKAALLYTQNQSFQWL